MERGSELELEAVRRPAAVLTVSDGVSAGNRADRSGDALVEELQRAGFAVVDRRVVPDESSEISAALVDMATSADLVVSTGGTGLGPRDVTPEATRSVIDREAPGLTHLMLSRGIEHTDAAALSQGVVGVIGSSLVINLPGSPRGAVENLSALMALLPHALELLAGHTEH